MFIRRASPLRGLFGALLQSLQDALFTLRRDDEPLMRAGAAKRVFVTMRGESQFGDWWIRRDCGSTVARTWYSDIARKESRDVVTASDAVRWVPSAVKAAMVRENLSAARRLLSLTERGVLDSAEASA
jgi:hypothetical protein